MIPILKTGMDYQRALLDLLHDREIEQQREIKAILEERIESIDDLVTETYDTLGDLD